VAVVSALLVLVVLGGCSSSSGGNANGSTSTTPATATAPGGQLVPGSAWRHIAPAQAGLDGAVLDDIARTAQVGKSHCLVVERDGAIAGEWQFAGTTATQTQDIFSATKSITSLLVGIAQDEGDLHIDDSASKWIPEWRGTAATQVTVRDLLSNDSGREWSPIIDYVRLIRSSDRTAFAIGLPQQHPPGQVWAYNNSAIQTLQQVLQGATGEDVSTFAEQRLFRPLGMAHTRMTTDRAGNTQTFEGVQSNCEDLARLGLMVQRDGKWGSRQIVSSSWVAESTGKPSTPLNAAYGYLWWLNRKGVLAGPLSATNLAAAANPTTARGQLVPGAPDDLYWALGLGNQLVQVDPGSRTVVVRLGTAEAQPKPPTFGPSEASQVVTRAVRH
jgi:CubicO group peptidase (beta-lactamase class C family)